MDAVRFGRVLGIGTRLAARTLVSAMDAAKAESPATTERPAKSSTPVPTIMPKAAGPKGRTKPTARVSEQVANVRVTAGGLRQGGKKFGEAVWGPFARLSGVLWLEVTGVFFGLFAFLAGVGAWKQRLAWQHASAVPDARTHLFLLAAVAVVFGYFCVSSFVKANRRGRRR